MFAAPIYLLFFQAASSAPAAPLPVPYRCVAVDEGPGGFADADPAMCLVVGD
jgi:hypothetical protein